MTTLEPMGSWAIWYRAFTAPANPPFTNRKSAESAGTVEHPEGDPKNRSDIRPLAISKSNGAATKVKMVPGAASETDVSLAQVENMCSIGGARVTHDEEA